jgi:adenosine/AMP kinase
VILLVSPKLLVRSRGNYASLDQIAEDVKAQLGGGHIGVVFPITLRNSRGFFIFQ